MTVGIDYGLKRVGVSVGAGWASRPLCVVEHNGNETSLALELVRLARAEAADAFVVGLPLDRDGKESEQSQLTRKFGQVLTNVACNWFTSPNVFLWDERFSTREAETILARASIPGDLLDAIAACAILDDFFASEAEGAERLAADPAFQRERQRPAPAPASSTRSTALRGQAKASLQAKNKRLLRYMDQLSGSTD